MFAVKTIINKLNKQILVTGGLGYIGSHTVVCLLEAGFDVVVVDNLSNAQASVKHRIEEITGKEFKFYPEDLTHSSGIEAIFKENSFSSIIHFAAFKAVGESVQKPLKYYQNNLISLLNLLNVAEKNKVNHFIFSSSCTVYGEPKNLPLTEEAPFQPPESPYAQTKKMSEEILMDCTKVSNLEVIALRYFNPIGAHPSGKIGELPIGTPNNLIPYLTQTVAGIREKLSVFGNNYPTRDGTPIRDYIHVMDLAAAHVLAVQRMEAQKNTSSYEIYNLGTGTGNTVLEVIHSFQEATGEKVPYQIVDRRAGDIIAAYANNEKAKKELGWQTKYQLKDALKHAWNWQKQLNESK